MRHLCGMRILSYFYGIHGSRIEIFDGGVEPEFFRLFCSGVELSLGE